MKEAKELLQKHEFCMKKKVDITNFLDKGNVDVIDLWE